MHSFKGQNPTELYYQALMRLVEEGDEVSPRGKLVKELRPASVEFENPYNRVTFLGSRRINPFFQLAESLWIVSGRADVEWLTKFNANMSSFSDDGVHFNAPYGERIRSWNKNALNGVIINPVDQLVDAYIKLTSDKDTRQAVVVISNPMFDNATYTVGKHGKDIACNLIFTFKIRHDKLNMTVFNRSNDAHWGLWGANLCQFTTIQEVMLSWLVNSGLSEFQDLKMGEYCQVTDSLHIYLDDYGAKCTTDILDYYKNNSVSEVLTDFTCVTEPRMTLNHQKFDDFLSVYWTTLDPYIMDDNFLSDDSERPNLFELVTDMKVQGIVDDYWYMVIKAMICYRLVKLNKLVPALNMLNTIQDCQLKISMSYFLKTFIKKALKDVSNSEEFSSINKLYSDCVQSLSSSLVNSESTKTLEKYLEL